MHAKGKFLLTHAGGENAIIMDLYPDARFDIADSVTSAPMTKMSLGEYRKSFGDKVTI